MTGPELAGPAALDKPGRGAYKPLLREKAKEARVAQLVEHATENRSVGGSIPPPGTIGYKNSILKQPVNDPALIEPVASQGRARW